jgi:hypothetical protein
VGSPVAVNPDQLLRAHAKQRNWPIRDFRRRARIREAAAPLAVGGAGVAAGIMLGYTVGRIARR